MTAIGSLRVELELEDGSFTTRVIRAGTTLQGLEKQVGQNVLAVRRLDSVMSNFGTGLRDMVLTLGLARNAIENIYSVFGKWAVSIVKTNAEVERSITLLKSMSAAGDEVARLGQARGEFAELLKLSSQAPFQLQSLTDAFVKFRAAGIEPAMGQLRSLTDAVAAMGGTDEQFKRASIAIQQMAGKGVVSMEELRQQLGEAVPRAIELMARSMNMSIADFTRRVALGQVEARHALNSMAAEFNRTFGGAAAAQMDTFTGKITQLQTAWTNFALQVGGTPGSGGFFDAAKDFVQKISDTLNSEQGQDFAARLGRGLEDVTKALISGIDAFLKYADAIETGLKALLAFFVAAKGYALLAGFVTMLNGMRLAMVNLAGPVTAATAALLRFDAAMKGIAAAGFLGTLGGMAGGITSFVSRLGALVTSANAAFWALSGVSRLLLGFGAVGFVAGAISLIASAFEFFSGKAQNASEALERFKEGASDKATLAGVESRLKELPERIAEERKQLEALRASIANQDNRLNFTSPANQLRRAAEQGGERDKQAYQAFLAQREALVASAEKRITDLQEEERDLRVQLEGAHQKRLDREIQLGADREITGLRGRLRRLNNEYDAAAKEIQAKIAALPAGTKDTDEPKIALNREAEENRTRLYQNRLAEVDRYLQDLETKLAAAGERERTELDAQIRALDLARARARGRDKAQLEEHIRRLEAARARAGERERAEFEARIKLARDLREEIENEAATGNVAGATKLNSANAENNIKVAEGQITRMRARMAELRAEMQGGNSEAAKMAELLVGLSRMEGLPPKLKEQLQEVATELGNVKDQFEAFRKAASATRTAEAQIATMQARIAELRAQITGGNPELAKMNVLLEELGRMQGLDPELQERMRTLAAELGTVKQEFEQVSKIAAASRTIQTGLEKAATEVSFLKDKLQDLDLPDEERQARQFERTMMAAFEKIADAAGILPDKINEIRNAMEQAIGAAREAANLKIGTSFLDGQNEDLARLQPKGSKGRLDQQVENLKVQYERARAGFIKALSGDELAKALDAAETRYNTKLAVLQQQNAKEGESAGRRTSSMLEALQARYAELTEELEDGAGTFAKYWARLGESGRASAAGQQILTVAKQVDELTERVEKAANAWSLLKSMLRQGDEGRAELGGIFDILGQGRDPTGIEGPYLAAAAKIKRAIQDIQATTDSEAAKRKAIAAQEASLPGIAQGMIAQQVTNWRQSQRSIRESLAETLAERRQLALESVAIEERSIRALIEKAQLGAVERARVEEELQAYIQALREKAARESEGPIVKMMRDWRNLSENVESVFARAFDGMADALTEFVVTGKLNMNDLANSFIRDITRMALKAAASGIWGMISGKDAGGGGLADFFGSVARGIGGLFAGGGGSAGIAGGLQAHTGAIIGKSGQKITADASLFANAPRFHKGSLRPDEVPTILQKGEAVFTAAQLAELGRLNRSYEFVERTLGMIARALTVPTTAVPSMPAAPQGGAGGMPGNVVVNVINQSGQPMEGVAGQPRMDIEGMIVDVVINNMQRPGRMRDAVKGLA